MEGAMANMALDSEKMMPPEKMMLSSVFAGIERLKQERKPVIEDSTKYLDNWLGDLARNKRFEMLTLGIIVVNALEMGWSADWTARGMEPDDLYSGSIGFIIVENFFAVFFTLEILIRFLAFRRKHLIVLDVKFVFDMVLVVFMDLEIWVFPFAGSTVNFMQNFGALRLLRLARLTRLLKLLRALPELLLIITSLAAAARAVIWTMILMMMITFLWAILFVSQYHQGNRTDEEVDLLMFQPSNPDRVMYYFGSMSRCFLSLACRGIMLDDLTYTTDSLRMNEDWAMLLAFLVFIFLNSLTMMNFMVGILVQMVACNAEGEKQRMVEDGVKDLIMGVCKEMDTDASGLISRAEFVQMKDDRKVMEALMRLGIQKKHFDMYTELLFTTVEEMDKGVSFNDLLKTIIRSRPGTTMSVMDFVTVRKNLTEGRSSLLEQLRRISGLLEKLSEPEEVSWQCNSEGAGGG